MPRSRARFLRLCPPSWVLPRRPSLVTCASLSPSSPAVAVGGGLLAASGTGVTGIFGILLCLAQPVQYAIMFAVAALVSFGVSFVLYKDEPKASEQA